MPTVSNSFWFLEGDVALGNGQTQARRQGSLMGAAWQADLGTIRYLLPAPPLSEKEDVGGHVGGTGNSLL